LGSIFNTSVFPIKEKDYIPWKLYVDYPFLYYTQIPTKKTAPNNSAPIPNLKGIKLQCYT